MRRSYNQIIVEAYVTMQEQGTHLFSIDDLSKSIKASWRTTRSILKLLWRLGIVQRRVIKKRELWIIRKYVGNV